MYNMELDPAECFELAVAAVRGERVPFDPGGSKMLSLMLGEDDGCDAEVTPEHFMVQLGGPRRVRYESFTVPALVSWLVERIGSPASKPVTGVITPDTVGRTDLIPWSLTAERYVRIELRSGSITIRVRPTREGLGQDLLGD